ncbi:protein RKD1 [Diospyros lotus]|uniref:protein RKD1 n=1 Tax=Diospyros lotus TaxID=55363 RepID=UPI0022593BE3|nr:protein RKD1 [Diospyros lotus]
MAFNQQFNVPKMEDWSGFEWLYLQEQTDHQCSKLDQQPTLLSESFDLDQFMNSFEEFEKSQFQFLNHRNDQIAHLSSCGDIGFWDFTFPSFNEGTAIMDSNKLLLSPVGESFDSLNSFGRINTDFSAELMGSFTSSRAEEEAKRPNIGKPKSGALELHEIQKYFDVPITKAAKELKVGLTVLKKRCRELNIMRWPHRKIKSLNSLIHNVKKLGLTTEVEMLEEHRRMLEKLPELELTERTKKLRQACFKANYKKRRSLSGLSNV